MVFGDLTAVRLQPEQRSEVGKRTADTCGQLGAFEFRAMERPQADAKLSLPQEIKKINKMCRLKSQEIQPSTVSRLAHNAQELRVFQVVGCYPWLVEVTSPPMCVCAPECRGQTLGSPGHQSLVKC